jgi:hypothetical protein
LVAMTLSHARLPPNLNPNYNVVSDLTPGTISATAVATWRVHIPVNPIAQDVLQTSLAESWHSLNFPTACAMTGA